MNSFTVLRGRGLNKNCSAQMQLFYPSSISEGVEKIKKIIDKDILCRHDIGRLNHLYCEVDRLERNTNCISGQSTLQIMQELIKKVQTLFFKEEISANDLIFLYHLQNFIDKELKLDQCFEKKHLQYPKDAEHLIELLLQLPYCTIVEDFDTDLGCLIGLERTDVTCSPKNDPC